MENKRTYPAAQATATARDENCMVNIAMEVLLPETPF
jgi:hypothetical protein